MSSTQIQELLDQAQATFDRRAEEVETDLDVEDAALLQLRKGCRLLTGADVLLEEGFYTLVIEASFVAIERTVEFRLLEQRELEPDGLPGSHTGVYDEAASAGVFSEGIAADLTDLWRDHRAKTYYRDGLATRERAVTVHALATEVHDFVVGRSSRSHECRCE